MLKFHPAKHGMNLLIPLRKTVKGNDYIRNFIKQIKTLLSKLISCFTQKYITGVDISNCDDIIKVSFEYPENISNEIKMFIDKNQLIITKSITNERKIEAECYVATEVFNRWPYLTIRLPYEVDQKLSNIVYKNGILEFTIPKKRVKNNEFKINLN